jgi:LytS/YehU family sensor histidine kinase
MIEKPTKLINTSLENSMKLTPIQKITLSALFLSMAMLFPFLTGQIPQFGQMLLPMHLPILLCGFIIGPKEGGLIGFIAPLLRSLILGMPPFFPTASAMAFELATYGIIAGIMLKVFPKKFLFYMVSLVIAMVAGRIVWGGITWIFLAIQNSSFSFELFISGAILNAFPGIILQILVIPPLLKILFHSRNKNRAEEMGQN